MGLDGTTSVFVSYSHQDVAWLDGLRKLLAPCFRENRIAWWDDTAIRPGDDWEEKIDQAIGTARVAVLLVSANFLASEFIAKKELPFILRAAAAGRVRVLWMLLNDCLYETTGLLAYQALHDHRQPLDGLNSARRRGALAKIARSIVAEVALFSVESGLGVVDATSRQLEAVSERRPAEAVQDFGIVAVRGRERIEFRGPRGDVVETIDADDLLRLNPDDLELIQLLEEGMRRQFALWKERYPSRVRADGTIDAAVEDSLRGIAGPMCSDLGRILDFLGSIGKYLHDHYGRYRFICDRLI